MKMLTKFAMSLLIFSTTCAANAFVLNNKTNSTMKVNVSNPNWWFSHDYYLGHDESVEVVDNIKDDDSSLFINFYVRCDADKYTKIFQRNYIIGPKQTGYIEYKRFPETGGKTVRINIK